MSAASWMQQSHYDGPTPSGSPSAYSTPPPPEAQTPPHLNLNMNMYGQQSEHGYNEWSHHVAVAGHDMAPSMDDGSGTYNQYVLDDTALHLQDYACGLEQAQQMYAESTTSCGVESTHPYSLTDDLHLGMEVPQY